LKNKKKAEVLVESRVSGRAAKSAFWLYGRHLATNIINLGAIAILARQLSPADFGLVALAQVILRFILILGSSGVSEYVIYDHDEGRESRLNAAFWLNLFLSFGVGVLCVSLVPAVTSFYSQPNLSQILIFLIAKYLFQQMAVVPDALIRRSVEFKKLVIRDGVLEILSSTGSVAMALTGWGVWSLVIPTFIASVIRTPITFLMASWLPKISLGVRHWMRVGRYSANVLGGQFVNTVITEGDTLFVGKLLGSHLLGIYNIAWQSANLVKRNVSGVVGKIAMPALSAVSQNPERLRSAYTRMLSVLGVINFPLLIGLFVVADDFILAVYGAKWEPAILPLRILIIFAVRNTIGSPISVIFNVVGRPDINFKFGLLQVPFYLGAIWFGARYGIVGVATAVTVVRTLFGVFMLKVASSFVHYSFRNTLRSLRASFLASCIMGVTVFILKFMIVLVHPLEPIFNLMLLVPLGGLIYLVLLRTAYNGLSKELVNIMGSVSAPLGMGFARVLKVT
jgi:PST family polysaccharide transporter